MDRTPVASSNIAAVAYHVTASQLEVEFKSGDVYTYENVTGEEFDALMGAESIGRHLNQYIKPTKPAKHIAGPKLLQGPAPGTWTAQGDPTPRHGLSLNPQGPSETKGGEA